MKMKGQVKVCIVMKKQGILPAVQEETDTAYLPLYAYLPR